MKKSMIARRVFVTVIFSFNGLILGTEMNIISQSRSVSAYNSYGDSDIKTAPDFGNFDQSAHIYFSNWGSSFSAEASQSSSLTPSIIYASGYADESGEFDPEYLPPNYSQSSLSTFEVLFEVNGRCGFFIAGLISVYSEGGITDYSSHFVSINLSSHSGEAIFSVEYTEDTYCYEEFILNPGVYSLRIEATAFGSYGPDGFGGGRAEYDFRAEIFDAPTVYVDANSPNDPGNGTEEDPYRKIQPAVDSSVLYTQIIVLPGTYRENIVINSKNIEITSVNPNDPNVVAATILDGRQINSVIRVSNSNLIIKGLTITNGIANSGGAINCVNSSLSVSRCVISSCMAKGNDGSNADEPYENGGNGGHALGGGIYSNNSDVEILNCDIMSCIALGGKGGKGITVTWEDYPPGSLCFDEPTAGGSGGNAYGGGIYSQDSRIYMANCSIKSCHALAGDGGAGGDNVIVDCGESGFGHSGDGGFAYGGGLCSYNGNTSVYLKNCLIFSCLSIGGIFGIPPGDDGYFSWGDGIGAGIYNSSNCEVVNCTIADNYWGVNYEPGIPGFLEPSAVSNDSYFAVRNSILVGDINGSGSLSATFSNVNNFDPLFADPANGDFHLKSQYGRWNPVTKRWVYDTVTSPCIDAGDPSDQGWKKELWPHGKRINMGAYGGTPEASMSSNQSGMIADINRNDCVGSDDLILLLEKWLREDILFPEDMNLDGRVDLIDFSFMAGYWLFCLY